MILSRHSAWDVDRLGAVEVLTGHVDHNDWGSCTGTKPEGNLLHMWGRMTKDGKLVLQEHRPNPVTDRCALSTDFIPVTVWQRPAA